MSKYPIPYLPIRVSNAEKDQERIFPAINNIDLSNIQKMVTKPVIVFDLDQKILLQVSPSEIFKVGIDTDWEIISTLIHDIDFTIPGTIQDGDMVIVALGKTQRQINETISKVEDLFSTKTTNDLTEGSNNQYFTVARARSASIQNSINPNETQRGASQKAVYLALEALRQALELLISQEETARGDADQLLANSIQGEISNRQGADNILQGNINTEISDRIQAINNVLGAIGTLKDDLELLIEQEEIEREVADSTLQDNINTEMSNRMQAINALASTIITDFKTVNGESIVGTGNIAITGSSSIDSFLDIPDTPNSYVGQSGKDLFVSGSGIGFRRKRPYSAELLGQTLWMGTPNVNIDIPGLVITVTETGLYEIEGSILNYTGDAWTEFAYLVSVNSIAVPISQKNFTLRHTSQYYSFYRTELQLTSGDVIRLMVRRVSSWGTIAIADRHLKATLI